MRQYKSIVDGQNLTDNTDLYKRIDYQLVEKQPSYSEESDKRRPLFLLAPLSRAYIAGGSTAIGGASMTSSSSL